MKLIEFLSATQNNSERCLFTLYFSKFREGVESLTSNEIRERLRQARVRKVAMINVSDALAKSGALVDFSESKRVRKWHLTQSGVAHVEGKIVSRGIEFELQLPKKMPESILKVLFLGLGPTNATRLRLDEETREIEAKIRLSEYRDNFNFKSKWAVRPADLLQYLNENRPDILHLSGHGAPDGSIAFEDAQGRSKLVSPEALSDTLGNMKDNIKVVFLNACHSNGAATKIAREIDCVVGMDDEIDDRTAIQFAATFYSALGFGKSVRQAFREGRAAVVMEGLPGDHLLTLHNRPTVDPDKIFLIK